MSKRIFSVCFASIAVFFLNVSCRMVIFSGIENAGTSPVKPPRHIFDPLNWTVEDGLSGAFISGTRVSPDGTKVAYTVMRAHCEKDFNEWITEVYVASANSAKTEQIGCEFNTATSPEWTSDGSGIAFIAVIKDGELKGTQQIFLVTAGGGKPSQITAIPGGVLSFRLSPVSGRIAFTSSSVSGNLNYDGPEDFSDSSCMKLSVTDQTSGALPKLLINDDLKINIEDFNWSPDEKSIVFTHSASDREGWHQDISAVATANGEISVVAATPAAEMNPIFSPDGSTIAYIAGEDSTADFSAWRVKLAPAPGRKDAKSATLAATYNEMPVLIGWANDSSSIFFEEEADTVRIIGALPLSGKAPVILSSPDFLVENVSISSDGGTFGFTMQNFSMPQEVYLAPVINEGKFDAKRISVENHDMAKMPVPRMEILRWKSTDGMQTEGILTYPVGYENGKKYPLVLSVHGGPAEKFSQTYFGQPDVYPYALWATRGFAVLRINPRGSGGYGAAYRKANIADWGGKPYDDLISGVDKVIGMGIADPDRLVVAGWSYGGFMTANITCKTDRFKAAVVGAGPVNLVSQTGTSDLPEMIPAYMGGYPWEKPELYKSQSPVFSVGKVSTPTLILHGTDDTRVPYSQGQEWYNALRARGVECILTGYPRSGHVVHEPQLMKDIHVRVTEWLEKHLAK